MELSSAQHTAQTILVCPCKNKTEQTQEHDQGERERDRERGDMKRLENSKKKVRGQKKRDIYISIYIYRERELKKTLFIGTRQYNIQIYDKTIFLK